MGSAHSQHRKLVDHSYEIALNDPHANELSGVSKGATNHIRTSKYTILSFLPINLFEQFRRLANFYFLLVVCVQLVPGVSPFPLYTSVGPLVFILSVTAVKEGVEDYVCYCSCVLFLLSNALRSFVGRERVLFE